MPTLEEFVGGKRFGIDVGTKGIGFSVWKGRECVHSHVLYVDEGATLLDQRRNFRRQRRALDTSKKRRKWFRNQLESLGIPAPDPLDKFPTMVDGENTGPVDLRVKAVNGEILDPDQLHAALYHLIKRRGRPETIPWGKVDRKNESGEDEDEIRETLEHAVQIRNGGQYDYPSEWLQNLSEPRGRTLPTDWLMEEFRRITEVHKDVYPKLYEKTEWLIGGEKGKLVDNVYVVKKKWLPKENSGDNYGVFSFEWPRFENRSPALDKLQPYDEEGRPIYCARKDVPEYKKFQKTAEILTMKVIDPSTGEILTPPPDVIESILDAWGKSNKSIGEKPLKRAVRSAGYEPLAGQGKLKTPDSYENAGRSSFSRKTLKKLTKLDSFLEGGGPQPVLRPKKGEERMSPKEAVKWQIEQVSSPLLRHRLELIRRELRRLEEEFFKPDYVIVEKVSDRLIGRNDDEKRKKKAIEDMEENRQERLQVMEDNNVGRGKALKQIRLMDECDDTCVYCGDKISPNDALEIDHIVPRSQINNNEWFNLVVVHDDCNQAKGDRTPYQWLKEDKGSIQGGSAGASKYDWDKFKSIVKDLDGLNELKAEILISPNAEAQLSSRFELQETSYFARSMRHMCLTMFEWLSEGKDPGNSGDGDRYLTTSGYLTSTLRHQFGLNGAMLNDIDDETWESLDFETRQIVHNIRNGRRKNRIDLRNHAIDAMVVGATLPWYYLNGYEKASGWYQDTRNKNGDPKAKRIVNLTRGLVEDRINTDSIPVKTHRGNKTDARKLNATRYGCKRDPWTGKKLFFVKEKLNDLHSDKKSTLKNAIRAAVDKENAEKKGIFPRSLNDYINFIWEEYCERENRGANGRDPDKTTGLSLDFYEYLSYDEYIRWLNDDEKEQPDYIKPCDNKNPIKSVKLIQSNQAEHNYVRVNDENGTYVRANSNEGIEIWTKENGDFHVKPLLGIKTASSKNPPETFQKLGTIKKGDMVTLDEDDEKKFRVVTTGTTYIELVPPHIGTKSTEGKVNQLYGLSKSRGTKKKNINENLIRKIF